MNNPNTNWIIKGRIWNKESSGVIDYDNMDFREYSLKVNFPGNVFMKDEDIKFTKTKGASPKPNNWFSLDCVNNDYLVTNQISQTDLSTMNSENNTWLVYKGWVSNDNNDKKRYLLSEGDILKLGRIYWKIWEINSTQKGIPSWDFKKDLVKSWSDFDLRNKYQKGSDDKDNTSNVNNNNKNEDENLLLPDIRRNYSHIHNVKNLSVNKQKLQQQQQVIFERIVSKETQKEPTISKYLCRICYRNDNEDTNPLINPCKCSGSMRYVHYDCWKNWLTTKIISDNHQNDTTISYLSEDIKCELCKEKLPDYMLCNSNLFNISFCKVKYKKYLIVEYICPDKRSNRTFNIVSLDKSKSITIGRGNDCNISIPDLSVSRLHCFLTREKSKWYLEDNNSKFGSLILVQTPKFRIISGLTWTFQISKIFFKWKMEQLFSIFSCCSVNECDLQHGYQKQNIKYIDKLIHAEIKANVITEESEENNESRGELIIMEKEHTWVEDDIRKVIKPDTEDYTSLRAENVFEENRTNDQVNKSLVFHQKKTKTTLLEIENPDNTFSKNNNNLLISNNLGNYSINKSINNLPIIDCFSSTNLQSPDNKNNSSKYDGMIIRLYNTKTKVKANTNLNTNENANANANSNANTNLIKHSVNSYMNNMNKQKLNVNPSFITSHRNKQNRNKNKNNFIQKGKSYFNSNKSKANNIYMSLNNNQSNM